MAQPKSTSGDRLRAAMQRNEDKSKADAADRQKQYEIEQKRTVTTFFNAAAQGLQNRMQEFVEAAERGERVSTTFSFSTNGSESFKLRGIQNKSIADFDAAAMFDKVCKTLDVRASVCFYSYQPDSESMSLEYGVTIEVDTTKPYSPLQQKYNR